MLIRKSERANGKMGRQSKALKQTEVLNRENQGKRWATTRSNN